MRYRFYGCKVAVRRMCQAFEKYEKVTLDFTGVYLIVTGFADELFGVFVNAHPDLCLEYENASEDVEKMIRHVGFKRKE